MRRLYPMTVVLNEAERDEMKKEAERRGISQGELVRSCVFGNDRSILGQRIGKSEARRSLWKGLLVFPDASGT